MRVTVDAIVKLVIMAGEVMLRNGAETSRVEETMEHMATALGARQAEAFAMITGLYVTVTDAEGRIVTVMRRIRDRTINLDRIAKVNELSRRLTDGRMEYQEAQSVLERISRERTGFSLIPSMFASGVVGGGFLVLQSGSALEVGAAFVIAACVRYIAHIVTRLHGVRFTFEFLGAATAAVLGSLLHWWLPEVSRDLLTMGGIMPLVPGVAITNAIRDLIAGDLLSGLIRGLEASLTTTAVTMGVVIILAVSA